MMPTRQPDLFARQPDLFDSIPPATRTPDPAMIRGRLHALLATAKAAERNPWSAQEARVNAITFHQMANWLPEAERDALRVSFADELHRLGLASYPAAVPKISS